MYQKQECLSVSRVSLVLRAFLREGVRERSVLDLDAVSADWLPASILAFAVVAASAASS